MKSFARTVFGFLVHLHPREFRAEFGDEMLWIFDEQMASAEQRATRVVLCVQLVLDVLRSVFLQHAVREQSRHEVAQPHFSQIESSSGVIEVTQTAFVAFCCLFCILGIALGLNMLLSSL